jgi:hypothetical protein
MYIIVQRPLCLFLKTQKQGFFFNDCKLRINLQRTQRRRNESENVSGFVLRTSLIRVRWEHTELPYIRSSCVSDTVIYQLCYKPLKKIFSVSCCDGYLFDILSLLYCAFYLTWHVGSWKTWLYYRGKEFRWVSREWDTGSNQVPQ